MAKQTKSYRIRDTEVRADCPVCSGSRLSHVFRIYIYGYHVSHCKDCGIRFLNPPPNEATLTAINIADSVGGDGFPASETRLAQMKVATAKLYLDLLDEQIDGEGGQLLDLGCGRGDLLLEAQARGFEVTGVELSAHAAAIANRRLGDERVFVGSVDGLPLPEESFDVVVLTDVVEHAREPLSLLRRAHGLLKPGGLAEVITPSLDSWSARLMRRYWLEYMPQHLYYFSERAMKLALEEAGFSSVTLAPDIRVVNFDYVYYRFHRYPVPLVTPLVRLVKKLVPEELADREMQLPVSGIVALARK